MVRAVEIRQREDRVVEISRNLGWFGVKNVQSCSNLFLFQGQSQRGLIHHFTAGCVDENGIGFHQGEPGGVDQFSGLRNERNVQRHDVGSPKNIVDGAAMFHASLETCSGVALPLR